MMNIDYVLEKFAGKYLTPYNGGQVSKYYRILMGSYNSGWRYYHDFNHIGEGLKTIYEFYSQDNLEYFEELVFAWMMHDVTIMCRNAELLSAMFAIRAIEEMNLNLQENIVSDLVMETTIENALYEGPSQTGLIEADIMHDLDFIRMGVDRFDEFLKNDTDIADEYGKRFNKISRMEFLYSLTKMKNIYRTDLVRKDSQNQALININQLINTKYIDEYRSKYGNGII